MNLETLHAPGALCAHHRRVWKELQRGRYARLAKMVARVCPAGRSDRCSREWESGK